jgi:hypothetical protein
MVLGVLVWLWPIGVGGRMPVGGDVTQFFLGLMGVLARAIGERRLPIWNDLWGYGFPGLAESQMGVYYPIHWFVYGLLPLEAAYTASLVGHTIWAAIGAYWASRRFGVSAAGSALGGFAWATSGFFMIHQPHQWGYTCGSWMPWAWGLAWLMATGEGSRRTPFLLALVLTLQLLPGHFQLAFTTQVGVALIGLWALVERPAGRARTARGVAALAIATAGSFVLAAAQLWPTLRLARMAESERDFEYLSGFASTPIHLVSYVAPGLFHLSPLWRPLAWDPFHTSPEEHLAYIGLVPLFLAIGMLVRSFRRDRGVRVLAVLAAVTLVLSLGPYAPGFRSLILLPGFSFFRSSARWSLATGLALAILAGKGFDVCREWPRPGRSLALFAVASALATALVVLGVELALASTDRPGWPALASGFDRALRLLPWSGSPSFRDVAARARRPQNTMLVYSTLARRGMTWTSASGPIFARERGGIYARELCETGAILLALLIVSTFAGRRRRSFAAALLVLTPLDLWTLGRHRLIDVGPIRPLSAQSPVLARLASGSGGQRILSDELKNLPMVVGAAPILAYRTLDLPAVSTLARMATAPLGDPSTESAVVGALRATGAAVRVLTPFDTFPTAQSTPPPPAWEARETILDPSLAGWLFGTDWTAREGPRIARFTLWRPPGPAARAWLVPLTAGHPPEILESWSGDPAPVIDLIGRSEPLVIATKRPEQLEIDVKAEGPALVLVSQLADPQWQAHWQGPAGTQPATIAPVLRRAGPGGWQAVKVPGPGRWTLRLEYSARDVRDGLAVSGVAWVLGFAAFFGLGRGKRT